MQSKVKLSLVIGITCSILLGCSSIDRFGEEKEEVHVQRSEYVVNDYRYAMMNVLEGSVSEVGLTVEFIYTGANEGNYGSWYELEYKDGDEWCVLPYTYDGEGEVAWTAEAYPVEIGKPREETINWEWLYGKLGSGEFRVVKDFLDFRGTGDYDKYYLASEFIIEQEND
jgi:hypothetical protein